MSLRSISIWHVFYTVPLILYSFSCSQELTLQADSWPVRSGWPEEYVLAFSIVLMEWRCILCSSSEGLAVSVHCHSQSDQLKKHSFALASPSNPLIPPTSSLLTPCRLCLQASLVEDLPSFRKSKLKGQTPEEVLGRMTQGRWKLVTHHSGIS